MSVETVSPRRVALVPLRVEPPVSRLSLNEYCLEIIPVYIFLDCLIISPVIVEIEPVGEIVSCPRRVVLVPLRVEPPVARLNLNEYGIVIYK